MTISPPKLARRSMLRRSVATLVALFTARTWMGCDPVEPSAPPLEDDTGVMGGDVPPRTPDIRNDPGPVTPSSCDATEQDLEGPFHVAGAPNQANLRDPGTLGDPLTLHVEITDLKCAPVAGAVFELWHADGAGDYHDDRCRCTLVTGDDGLLAIQTVWPGRYLDATGWRPAHLHVKVSFEGQERLTTQLYFEDDPYLFPNDSCSVCASGDEARIMAVETQDGVAVASQALVLDLG